MADNSVRFEIEIDAGDARIKALVEKAVEKQLGGGYRGEKKPAAAGDLNLVSKLGANTPPMSHQKKGRAPRRRTPETGEAPFDFEEKREFGGGVTEPVRGFQGNKTARRGSKRFRGGGKAFPHIEAFAERMQRIETELRENRESQRALKKFVSDYEKAFASGGAILTDPQGFVGGEMLRLLSGAGPQGALVVSAVSLIMSAPETVRAILRHLSVKGGPLNQDWVAVIEDTVTGFLSLESQQRRDLGLDSFVVAQTSGFQPVAGSDTYNSLLDRDEVRLNRLNQDEK